MPRRHTRRRGGALDPEPEIQRDNDPAHDAAPVRHAQREEINAAREEGILRNRIQNLREEPVPPMPAMERNPVLRRMPRGNFGPSDDGVAPRRLDFGGRRHRKTKKSTRRRRQSRRR